jgi:hypothetical protein
MATAITQPAVHTQDGASCLHDGHGWPLQACTSPRWWWEISIASAKSERHLPLSHKGAGEKPTLRVECASFHHTYCGPSLLASEKLEITISQGRPLQPQACPSLCCGRDRGKNDRRRTDLLFLESQSQKKSVADLPSSFCGIWVGAGKEREMQASTKIAGAGEPRFTRICPELPACAPI